MSESYSTSLSYSNQIHNTTPQQLTVGYSLPLRINNILINGNLSSIAAWTNHFKAFLTPHALFFAPLTGYLRNNTASTNFSSHLPMIPRLPWLEGIGQWTGWPTFLWVGGEVHARWWAMCTFGLRAHDSGNSWPKQSIPRVHTSTAVHIFTAAKVYTLMEAVIVSKNVH